MGGDSGAAGMVNRRVWSGPKVDTYGTVSPDGRSISHVNWSTGALAIYDIATGTDHDLIPVASKEDNAEESVISKDGRTVAYSWFNHETDRYELRLANLSGDPNPRRLYDNPDFEWIGPYDWSPDSKTIVAEVKRKDRTAQIALISAADGSIRVLKSIDWNGTGRIFFSPDGRFIGYDLPTADNIRQHDVLVLSVDGSHETVAVRHPSLNFVMGWSPDGKWLLFASDRTGAMGLWATAIADGKPQGAAELIRPDVGWPESLGITRSGALYYSLATLGGEGSHIQTAAMDFETGKLLVPATDVTHPHGESDSQPFWSHDGKLLAYLAVRGRLGSSNAQNNGAHMRDNALAIRAADTGQLINELPLQLGARIIGWTADDRAVWLAGSNSNGKQGLFRVEIQSGEMTTVASAILDGPAANGPISPDLPTAFYSRRVVGGHEVVFMSRNIASGEEKEIARGTGLNPYSAAGYALGAVNLSPDSKWICTVGVDRASNSRVLLLIPAAGGMPRTLMATPSAVPETELTNPRRGAILSFVAWDPSTQWVLAIRRMADSSQANELWRVPLDGGAPRKIEVEPSAPHSLQHRDLYCSGREAPCIHGYGDHDGPYLRDLGIGKLPAARRKQVMLILAALAIPLGLDLYLPVPEENLLTAEKIELGRRLFFDRRLSRDGSIACASCHDPERAYSDGRPIAVGVFGRKGRRNAPAIINRGYGRLFFWDGGVATLEDQVLKPIEDPNEMDLPLGETAARVGLAAEEIPRALASFVRSILSGDSPFDRFINGDRSALSPEQEAGLQLFRGKANCVACHVGPNFTDERLHNTGVAWRDGALADSGAGNGNFKTPTLREVAGTAPYMHDGSLATLEDVVEFYSQGGRPNPDLDPEIRPHNFTPEEKRALAAFLRSLTGRVRGGL